MAYNYEYPYTDPERSNADWLLSTVKFLKEHYGNLEEWKTEHEKAYEELKKFYDDVNAGIFPDGFEITLINWIRLNASDIVGEIIKNVFFGLTDDGYFVAYIPDSWSDIIFNTTGLDITISGFDYGHLVLSY